MLQDLGTIHTGSTPKTNDESLFGGDIPFVTPGDLGEITPIHTATRSLTDEGAKTGTLLPAGSVLVCCIGSLGKIGFAGRPLVTNQQINAIVFDGNKIDPRYGFFACRLLKPQLESMAPATTVPIVNKSRFSELNIPVPPLEEQRRIAAILDQADALRAKRREAFGQLESLAQSIFIEMFGDPVSNHMRWPELTFDQTVCDETSRAVKTLQSDYLDVGSYPIVDQGQKPVAGYTNDATKLCPCELPVVVFGDHTRAIKLITFPFAVGADGAKVLSPKPAVSAVYLAHLLRLLPIPNLGYSRHMKELKRLLYPIPPISLQKIFAERIQAVESLKGTHRVALAESDALFGSLQHRAFAGQLS